MRIKSLAEKYPPSEACACDVCVAYCARPGWWSVKQAAGALAAGYGGRMMLEVSPERSLGVLSPAFRGCDGAFALQEFAHRGCTFFRDRKCELHGTGWQPIECRFCHHDRRGLGPRCHAELEKDWNSYAGRTLVERWCRARGIWEAFERCTLGRLREAGR
jgi:hypothetical protein